MNKFRVNLHPAFFSPGSNGNPENPKHREGLSERELLVQQTREKLDENREQVQEQEFPNVAGEVAFRASSKYTNTEQFKNMEQLKRDRTRFQERVTSKNREQKIYSDVWTQKITEGFGFLIASLENNGYFKNKNKKEEINKIKELYTNEVYAQYEKNIWNAGNKTFNNIKDIIFGPNSEDYPANKIYCKLTGAATIFKMNRQHIEGYNPDVIESQINLNQQEKEVESMSDRQNRNFLSDDLPRYLWDTKKALPGRLNWLPLVSVKVDKPSKEDRKAINKFLKTSYRINVEGNKDKAVALMEALHDSRLNIDSGEVNYEDVLRDHGITVDKKYLEDIVNVGYFYFNTQRADNSVKDQHAIYLSVLGIIESEGGVQNAVNKFKPMVEKGKEDKKTEKKEGYETGEKLDSQLKAFAEKLGILDFTSVTRLSELAKNNPNYFKDTLVEKVLANLNNDRVIDARDTIAGGSKTGLQFLGIFKQVGEEKALSNLFEHAKLLNKSLGLGLDESKFTKGEIQKGNTELIILLQNIINKPGEDLYTLLSGHSENPFEGLDLENERASADKTATDLVDKMDLEALKKQGLVLPTPEEMQSGLSATLYKEYSKGIGIGSKISFDQWIKGVAMNTGFQVRDDGTVVVGLGLSYDKMIDLGKGWSTTPGVSANTFIPLGYGKPELTGSASARTDVAKSWLTKENGVYAKLGLQGGVTLMPSGVVIASAGFEWERNKASDVEIKEKEKEVEFREKIISPILYKVYQKRKDIRSPYATKLNFNDNTLVEDVKESISEVAKEQSIPSDKEEMLINGIIRLLLNYNGADLAQKGVKELIAQKMAEQYAMAWAEARKAHISDTTYLSGASLGVFWIEGTPFLGIYAGIKWTKHDLDGYGDRWGKEYEIEGGNISKWTDEELDKRINQRLGLSENNKLKIENGFIVIPASIAYRVNVNENMEGLMKKDDNGNVLIHTQTPMSIDVRKGAATQSGELIIGGKKSGKYTKLDQVGKERFTENDTIDQDGVLELGEVIDIYSLDMLDRALIELKTKFPQGDPIQNFDFNKVENIGDILNKLNTFDKNKKVKISLIRNDGGEIDIQDPVEGGEGKGLEIEYQSRYEIIDSDAKKIADEVYKKSLELKNPAALYAVKHEPWKEYDAFNVAMENKDYEEAKEAIAPIFKKLDDEIKDNKFSNILNMNEFTRLNGNALAQAMMAINNIFARSKQVRGGNGEYEFRRPNGTPKEMRAIIKERYKILNTLKAKVQDADALDWYESLFAATSKYVDKSEFAQKSAKAKALGNTVGFNLGDKTNPENPLFNPEIYDPMVDLDGLEGFSRDARDGLHKRAMSLFAKNPALINPVLEAAGIDVANLKEDVLKLDNMKINGDKCEISLDIGDKTYILSTGMKFGFFTQCVNHTIILDDISVTNEDGTSVTFNSGVWEDGRYVEGNKSTIVSTTQVGVSGSIVVHNENENTSEESENSPVKTGDATQGGKSVDSNTQKNGENDAKQGTEILTAGDGKTTDSGAGEI